MRTKIRLPMPGGATGATLADVAARVSTLTAVSVSEDLVAAVYGSRGRTAAAEEFALETVSGHTLCWAVRVRRGEAFIATSAWPTDLDGRRTPVGDPLWTSRVWADRDEAKQHFKALLELGGGEKEHHRFNQKLSIGPTQAHLDVMAFARDEASAGLRM